ncbi:MAG: FHA domain-containing protein [Anaerolineae bacterium]|nr:FHA domain-containing protein [Anaerolineae bacterium]
MERKFGKVTLNVTDQPQQEFILTQSITTIGSAETNDIPIKRAKVARAHARIECTEAGCTIFDLESSQGTKVNNQAVQKVNLANGDIINLGEAVLIFEAVTEADASDATVLDEAVFADDSSEKAPEPEAASVTKRDTLVELQAGGNKTPFFCVVGRYADVALLQTLAHHIGPDQPFYALQPPQSADMSPQFTDIDALVAHYADQIIGKQAKGPYFVGGYNVGGLVAFEMAQQLRAGGRDVAQVVLIDTPYLVNNPLPYWGYRSATTVKQTGDKLFEPLHSWVQSNIAPKVTGPLQEMRSTLQSRWTQQVERVVERLEEDYQTMQETLGDEGYETTVQLLQRYEPKSYSGQATLFLAEESLVRYSGALWGWHNVVANGLKVVTVPGSYINILKEPHVQTLAKQLAACLVS